MLLVMTETNLYKREQFLDCSHPRFGSKVLHFLNPCFNKIDDFKLRSLYPRGKYTLLTGQEGKWVLVPVWATREITVSTVNATLVFQLAAATLPTDYD